MRQIHPILYVNLPKAFKDNGLGQQPPPIEVDSEQEFEVEAIVGHRLFNGRLQYMVKLVGHNTSENIWLAEE